MMSTQKMTFPHSLMHLDHCSNAQAGQERFSSFEVKICILIYQTFVLEANTTSVCLKAPSPQSNKTGKCFPPWLCVSAELFLKNIESLRDKSETFNQKGPEWFLLHLITTSSLSPDGSAVLDSTADRSGEAEDSLQLGSWTPLLKSMEEFLKLPFHCWMLHLPLPQVAQSLVGIWHLQDGAQKRVTGDANSDYPCHSYHSHRQDLEMSGKVGGT